MQKNDIPKYIYEEIKRVKYFKFRYEEKKDQINKSIRVAELAATYPV